MAYIMSADTEEYHGTQHTARPVGVWPRCLTVQSLQVLCARNGVSQRDDTELAVHNGASSPPRTRSEMYSSITSTKTPSFCMTIRIASFRPLVGPLLKSRGRSRPMLALPPL